MNFMGHLLYAPFEPSVFNFGRVVLQAGKPHADGVEDITHRYNFIGSRQGNTFLPLQVEAPPHPFSGTCIWVLMVRQHLACFHGGLVFK